MSKYVIVGGVAGGATTAARLRRLDEKAEIILLERGEHISCADCGLPCYVGGSIEERSKLFVMTPARFRATLAVDVRTGHEATAIDRSAKTVTVMEKATGRRYVESYDALVLSPGAEPIRLKVLFDPKDGRLLGAQVVGYEGGGQAHRRAGAFITTRSTVRGLKEFEHAYAPPFASARIR